MLYFSKTKIILISIVSVFLIYISLSNFFEKGNFFDKRINLGLDLQGGSYLLLEIDNKPVISQKLQASLIDIRKFFNENNIKFSN